MSVDFLSVVAWLEPSVARRVVARCERGESLGELVDENGSTLHDFARDGTDIDLRACAKEMRRRAPPPEDFVAASLDGVPDVPELTDQRHARYVFSSPFPLLSVIDRVLAIPYGAPLLLGRAYRRLRPKARDRAEAAWGSLLQKLGGERAVARRIAPYVDRGGDAVEATRAMLGGLALGFARAREQDRDLLLACCLASETL
ncbi:MAG: hypothetical protein HOO96_02145 [Polyangiaceae bacterium]|nr:hypothetical protein [Polyangiaceae bacterium]